MKKKEEEGGEGEEEERRRGKRVLRQGSRNLELFESESTDPLPFSTLLPKIETTPRLNIYPERDQSCKYRKLNSSMICM